MAPSAGFNKSIIRWGLQRAQYGQQLLEQLPGYGLIPLCLEQMTSHKTALSLVQGMERGPDLAVTSSNRFKKVIMECVAAETDIKPFWEVKTYNHKFDQQAEIAAKLSTHWYINSSADQRGLATALRWAKIAGTGYIHLHWDPKAGENGDFVAEGLDPRDVLPIGPVPPWDTVQTWEGVIIREKKTVEHVRDLNPDLAYLIEADETAEDAGPMESTRAGRILSELNAQTRSPIAEFLFSDKPKTDIGKQPSVWLFTMYINDRDKNESAKPVEMGQFIDDPTWVRPEGIMGLLEKAPRIPANNWSYIVKPGEPLYPRKRMVVFTKTAVLYDGPSLYWHGDFPVLKLTPDPWPTTLLGLAVGWDLLALQNSLDWNLRVIDDHNAQVAQPGLLTDELSMGPNTARAFNTRRAGWKLVGNPMGKMPEIVPPPPLENTIKDHIEWIMREMDDLAGVIDLKNLAGLNQMPDTETVDKMIESKSWIIQGRSRVIEVFMREFAKQVLFNLAQFRTIKERYTILGPGGITADDMDFDPGTFIPDFVHSDDFDASGNLTLKAYERGPLPRYDRAKEVMRQMHFFIAPGSLLAASDVTRKMMYLQLFRGGILDVWTLAEVLGIPNMGTPPDGAKTIPERLAAQQMMGIMVAPNPANPNNPGPGRKPTGQKPPNMGKGGETVTET